MGERVVVLGAGYAGCVGVRTLERTLDDVDLVWVSKFDYHLVLHEVHRTIRDPSVAEKISVPVDAIASERTRFVRGTVVDLDPDERRIDLADDRSIEYDYALVALGSEPTYYGIPGVPDRAYPLNGLDDALAINEAVLDAGSTASRADPVQAVIGGAGLSGIQVAGELVELGEREGVPIDVILVEALEEVMPGADPSVQRRVRRLLDERDVRTLTDDPITEADPDEIHFDERSPLPYDVFVWTGGITGPAALGGAPIENQHNRLNADPTCRTSDDRVFAVGDAAIVGLDGAVAPPTAQAAWDAASVAADNIGRTIEGRRLRRWSFRDKGTLISVGDDAIAHDVQFSPVDAFGGHSAAFLKKLVAARWIATITSWRRGLAAWDAL